MTKRVLRISARRKPITLRHKPVAAGSRALMPWEGVRVKIEDLPAFRARWGLVVVGGDPDLDGEPWRPKVWVVEV